MSRKLLISLIVLGFLLLGAAALFAYAQRPGVVALEEQIALVGRMIVRGEDQVHVPDLAQRIIEDRRDFVLVDIRPPAAFEQEHIPGARNLLLTEIVRPENARSVARGRTLIVYGSETSDAAQVAALLRVTGVDTLTLRGGFNAWLRYTADPESDLEGHTPVLTRAERQAVACLFHGDFMPAEGIPIEPVRTAYVPPVTPVAPIASTPEATVEAAPTDPLGLGLHLGVGQVTPDTPEPDPLGLGLALGMGVGLIPAPAHPDPLGLGLGLGLGVGITPEPPHPDPLGLGLALGVGVGLVEAPAAQAEAPPIATPVAPAPTAAPPAAPPRRALRIGEGC